MVLCWIALPIFAILGIFSVKYRRLARESLDCLWRTALFRPCKSSLDERIRSDVTGHILRYSPTSARFFYRNYKVISFILLVLMIASAYFSAEGVYNYAKYGNCNGKDSSAFCIINTIIPNSGNGNVASESSVNASISSSVFCLNKTLQLGK